MGSVPLIGLPKQGTSPDDATNDTSMLLNQTTFENLVEFDLELTSEPYLLDAKERQRAVYTKLLKHVAKTSYYTWIGYFSAANLWRDRFKNYRPSPGLLINVHDVAVS